MTSPSFVTQPGPVTPSISISVKHGHNLAWTPPAPAPSTYSGEKTRADLLKELDDRAAANPRYRYWPERVRGTLLGVLPGEGPIFYRLDTHRLVIGTSGAGKGTAVLMPMLLHDDGHAAIVVDPKDGAIARVTAGYRQSLGPVHIIDPFGVTGLFAETPCDRFNPFDALHRDSPTLFADASSLASAICYAPDAKQGSDGGYFDRQAKSFLTGFILHITTWPTERATFRRLREITTMAPEEFDTAIGDPMLQNDACDGAVQRYANEFARHMGHNPKGFEEILSTIRSYIAWMETAQLRNVSEHSDFDFATVRNEGGTVYIVVPEQRMTEAISWLRVTLQAARLALQEAKSTRPVHFVIDETAAFGKFDLITTGLRAWRSAGLRLHLFFQNLSQIKEAFGEGTGAVTDADVIQFCGSQDWETLDYISKMFGERDMIVPTETRTTGTSRSSTEGHSHGTSETETVGSGTNASRSVTRTVGSNWSVSLGESQGTSSSSTRTTDHQGNQSSSYTSSGSYTSSKTETSGGSNSEAVGTTKGTSTNKSKSSGTTEGWNTSQTLGTNSSQSYSLTLQLRRTLRPEQVRQLGKDQMLVIAGNFEGALIHKEYFFANPRMVQRAALSFISYRSRSHSGS